MASLEELHQAAERIVEDAQRPESLIRLLTIAPVADVVVQDQNGISELYEWVGELASACGVDTNIDEIDVVAEQIVRDATYLGSIVRG